MQIPLDTKRIRLQQVFTGLHNDLLARRIHKQVAVARADRTITLDDLLLGEWWRKRNCVLDFAAVTERIVGLSPRRIDSRGLGTFVVTHVVCVIAGSGSR
jgi:hypothetical protein